MGTAAEVNYMPGPWTVDGEFDAEVGVDVLASDGRLVLQIEPYLEEWTDEEIANIRLIAAAPDLLRELKGISQRFRRCILSGGSDEEYADLAIAGATEAIAKAEGRA